MEFRCDPSEPAAKGSRGRRCHGTPTDTDQMSEGSCHAGPVSDTAGGALTPCPAPEAGPAGSAGTVEGLGPKKRAPPSIVTIYSGKSTVGGSSLPTVKTCIKYNAGILPHTLHSKNMLTKMNMLKKTVENSVMIL